MKATLTFILWAVSAHAQSQGIAGLVHDHTGASIAGATLVIHGRQIKTDAEGRFSFISAETGEFKVAVSSPGFASVTRNVTIEAGRMAEVDIVLHVDALQQSIAVTDESRGYQVPTATTATRTDTPLMEIPQSIQVIPKVVLADRQITQIGEVARNVSGLTRAIGFFERGDKFLVRGLLIDYSLKNGLKNNSVQSVVDVANIDRVEVVKGPSSVLYGRIEPGGVVNIVTKQPLPEHHFSADILVGRYGLYRPSIDATGPLNRGKSLMYRFTSAYERSESYVDFVKSESVFLAPVLTWRIGTKTTLTMEGEHLKLHGRPDGGLPASADSFRLPVHLNIGEPTDRLSNSSQRGSYYLTHAFSENWWVTNSFSALMIDSRRFYVSGPDSTFTPDKLHISRTILDLPETSQAFFQRLDTVGKFATGPVKHTLLFGLEVSRERFHRALYRYPIDTIDIRNPIYGLQPVTKPNFPQVRDQGADIGGAYVQDQISLLTQLKLLIGGRYDLSKTPYRDYSPGNLNDVPGVGAGPGVGVGPPGGPGTGWTGGTGTGAPSAQPADTGTCGPARPNPITGEYTQCSVEHPRAFSPRAGMLYQPARVVSLYVSYSKSFNPLQLQQYLNFQFLKPFVGRQSEAGAKFDLLRNRLQITSAVYRIVHSGLPLANPARIGEVVYSGFRRSSGAELDVTSQLIPGWSVTASYGYNLGFVKSAFPTNKLLGAPKHSGNLWTVYEFSKGRFKGWSAGFGISYTGIRNGNQFASFNLPADTRADAMLAYRRPRWSLQLNVKNLTDARYFETDAIQGLIYPGSPVAAEIAFRLHF